MTAEEKLLEEIFAELKEIKFWLRISGLPALQRAVSENLKDDEDILVYELSDGNRSTREIASDLKKAGRSIAHVTVANMWQRWSTVGLVAPSKKYKGRFMKMISLESLGIRLPKNLKKGKKK